MVRPRQLPSGWYPTDAEEIKSLCSNYGQAVRGSRSFRAAVVPHAGWFYSGDLAGRTIARLAHASTVVVVGGHLHAGDPIHVAMEDGLQTPLGDLEIDGDLRRHLMGSFDTCPDPAADNTVEIQMPFVAGLMNRPRILYVRCPPSPVATKLGAFFAQHAASSSIAVVGSTDLTHYGPNYGFTSHGDGSEAVRWVREVNDKTIIDAIMSMNPASVIEVAARDRSACSAGAAAVAVSFAVSCGAKRAELVDAYSSYDVRPASSFVGYAGIGFMV